MDKIIIDSYEIAPGLPAFVIAEIGFNHGGNMKLAAKMIEEAAQAGANAVKFQSYFSDELVHENSEHFKIIKPGELSFDDHQFLFGVAKQNSIPMISTPFSEKAVDVLEAMNVPAYKIASMDLNNHPLLRYIATLKKPMIVSTGMSTLEEIACAIEVIKEAGNEQIILLHCISKYPTPIEEANVRLIPFLHAAFNLPVGFSDHVLGNVASIGAM